MVIEVKKKLAAEFSANDSDEVIELLIYCRYILTLYRQASVIGVVILGIAFTFIAKMMLQ